MSCFIARGTMCMLMAWPPQSANPGLWLVKTHVPRTPSAINGVSRFETQKSLPGPIWSDFYSPSCNWTLHCRHPGAAAFYSWWSNLLSVQKLAQGIIIWFSLRKKCTLLIGFKNHLDNRILIHILNDIAIPFFHLEWWTKADIKWEHLFLYL